MAIIQVTACVRSPTNPDRSWEALFIVNPGAVDCRIPAKHLREVGITPLAAREYELDDGSVVQLEVGAAEIEFMGDTVNVTVIFAPDDTRPVLGLSALQSVGIEVDQRTGRLMRSPTVRLKSLRSLQS